MNERLHTLAAQAKLNGVEFDALRYYVGTEETFSTFAKLIVQECAVIADRYENKSAGCGYITKTKGQQIKEHFGVEE